VHCAFGDKGAGIILLLKMDLGKWGGMAETGFSSKFCAHFHGAGAMKKSAECGNAFAFGFTIKANGAK
jgi:hypothetical protein